MKYFSVFLYIGLLIACQPTEKVKLQIPWFVKEKLNDLGEYKYNYRDSLFKYQVLEIDRIENQSNYYSYLSNLRFRVNGNKKITFQYLQRAIRSDTTAFCNELIRETNQYLKPNGRPHRRYNMPFLLDFDIGVFRSKSTSPQRSPSRFSGVKYL